MSVIMRADAPDLMLEAGMGNSLDEIIVRDCTSFHIERMDKHCYVLIAQMKIGEPVRVVIQGSERGKPKIHMWAERE